MTDGPVVDALRGLYERDGRLTPPQVVAAAADPDSPLHDRFCWDDTEAADRYRKVQARRLIQDVMVVIERPDRSTVGVRAYVNVTVDVGDDEADPPDEREYVATVDALANPDQRQQVLRRAEAWAQAWKRRYQHLVEFDAIVHETFGPTTGEAVAS